MKKAHRFLTSLLVCSLAFSAGGCGSKASPDPASVSGSSSSVQADSVSEAAVSVSSVRGTIVMGTVAAASVSGAAANASGSADSSSESAASSSGAAASAASASSGSSAAASASGSSAGTENSSSDTGSFDIGSQTDSSYRNDYFGIRFRLPAAWSFADTEQLGAMNSAIAKEGTAEEVSAALEEGQAWFDMYATSDDGYQNINVTIQNIQAVYGAPADVNTLVDASLDTLRSALEAQGASSVSVEKGASSFLGEDSLCTLASGTMEGVPFFETQVYMKKGSYILCATAISYSENQTASLLDMFRPL